MASNKPPNQVTSRNLTSTSTSGAVSQGNIKLTEYDKRHAVVGIALSTVLIPTLRKYVDDKLSVFYKTLVYKFKVNTRNSTLYEEIIRKEGYGFHYHDPNDYVPSQ